MTELNFWIQILFNISVCITIAWILRWMYFQDKINQSFIDMHTRQWDFKKGDKNRGKKITSNL